MNKSSLFYEENHISFIKKPALKAGSSNPNPEEKERYYLS